MRQLFRSLALLPVLAAVAPPASAQPPAACVVPNGTGFSPIMRPVPPPGADLGPGFTATIGGRYVTFPASDGSGYAPRIGSATDMFVYPGAVAVDASGRLFVADTQNSRIRLFDRNGALLRDFGSEGSRYQMDPDTWMPSLELWGAAANPDRLLYPLGIALDDHNRLYVADTSNHRVLVFAVGPAPDYAFTLITAFGSWGGWASASNGALVQGHAPAPGDLNYPMGVAVDSRTRRLFVADTWNGRIQVYNFDASATAYDAAHATSIGSPGEAPGQLDAPQSLAFDADRQRLLVADTNNHRVQIFDPYAAGGATLLASLGNIDEYGEGHPGAEPRQFYMPGGVAVYANGFVVADTGNDRIQMFDASGCYQLSIQSPSIMAPGNVSAPQGVAADRDGRRIIVADTNNHRVQIFQPSGLTVTSVNVAPASLRLAEGTIGVDVTVTNTGAAPLANVVPGVALAQPATNVVDPRYAGGSPIAALAPGASAHFALQFTPASPGTGSVAVGAASMDPATGQTLSADPTGSVAFEVLRSLGPSMAITAVVPAAVRRGDTFDFTVSIANTGEVPLRDVTVGVRADGASGTAATAVTALASVGGSIALAAGESHTFDYRMTAGTAVGPLGFAIAASAVSGIDGAAVQAQSTAWSRVSDDVDAPVTTAVLSRLPNANGWLNGPVTVTLAADDRGGSGVGTIHYEYVVPGLSAPSVTTAQNPVSFALPDVEGTVSILYWATDKASPANREAARRLDVNIDSTAPRISPRAPVAPNRNGWYAAPVVYPFGVGDLSGVASVTDVERNVKLAAPYSLLLTRQGPAVSGSASAVDLAGNVATAQMPPVKIDMTRPCIEASRTPAPNADGWNNTAVTVSFKGYDPAPAAYTPGAALPLQAPCAPGAIDVDHALASGTASLSGPVTIASEGANHVISGTIVDRAGNSTSATALAMIHNVPTPIRVDRTAPDAFNQFDPATKDNVVIGCDDLSGVAGAAAVFKCHQAADANAVKATPAQIAIVSSGESDDDDTGGLAELRTYRIADAAGNTVTLVERVKRHDHSVQVQVVSFQQTVGCPTDCRRNAPVAPVATKSFEWALNADGSIAELTQRMNVGQGAERRRVVARYDGRRNETVIRDSNGADQSVTRSGLVLLRMVTAGATMAIEY